VVAFCFLALLLICLIKNTGERDGMSRLFSFLVKNANKSRPLRIGLIFLCSIAILCSSIVGLSYIPRRISHEMVGLELLMTGPDEAKVLQTVNIRMDGRLHNGIFARPHFRGLIELDAYPATINREISMGFSEAFGAKEFVFGHLRYERIAEGELWGIITDLHGSFHAKDAQFSFIVIEINYVEGHHVFEHRMIIAPAVDVDSARYVMQTIGVNWDGGIFPS